MAAMPISPAWDPSLRIWRLTVGETFDLGEIAQVVQQTDWRGAKAILWDLRTLTKGPGSPAEIHQAVELTERTSDAWRGARLAVLVARDVDFGIARMFGTFADQFDLEFHVFRDEPEALEWLQA